MPSSVVDNDVKLSPVDICLWFDKRDLLQHLLLRLVMLVDDIWKRCISHPVYSRQQDLVLGMNWPSLLFVELQLLLELKSILHFIPIVVCLWSDSFEILVGGWYNRLGLGTFHEALELLTLIVKEARLLHFDLWILLNDVV
jgi:hypothetical protein